MFTQIDLNSNMELLILANNKIKELKETDLNSNMELLIYGIYNKDAIIINYLN